MGGIEGGNKSLYFLQQYNIEASVVIFTQRPF
jgi:hypothetical protein